MALEKLHYLHLKAIFDKQTVVGIPIDVLQYLEYGDYIRKDAVVGYAITGLGLQSLNDYQRYPVASDRDLLDEVRELLTDDNGFYESLLSAWGYSYPLRDVEFNRFGNIVNELRRRKQIPVKA